MGWQDRDYNQIEFNGSSSRSVFWNLLFGSFPLGSFSGIRIRIHATFLWFIVIRLLFAATSQSMGIHDTLVSTIVLFAIIFLHEFGHCFASRSVGGNPKEVLLWMFGGLAFTDSPNRAWARFVTVAGGPLVNVLICVVSGACLLFMTHFKLQLPWNPFLVFSDNKIFANGSYGYVLNQYGRDSPAYFLWWFYSLSLSNLFFNLLPIFPLDGGQILQTILWKPLGYYKSMIISCNIGMIGGVIALVIGFGTNWSLVLIAVIGLQYCFQLRRAIKANGPYGWEEDEPNYAASLYDKPHKPKRRWFKWTGASAAARRKIARERAEQSKIDLILAKVHDKGLHSLTWFEKRTLRKATERQRKRDFAERL